MEGMTESGTEHDAALMVRRVTVVDPATAQVREQQAIRLAGGAVAEVTADPGGPVTTAQLDGAGLYAVPGLIDCHVHAMSVSVSPDEQADWYPSYVTARAAGNLRAMLDRGFTTVRDVGGADAGLARAVAEGRLPGPRLIAGGKALSQTGGHGDGRPGGRQVYDPHYFVPTLNRVCDGVPDVRRAVRDEVRRGAQHIKLHASGGCASPTDRLDSVQFSDEELRAIVEEAAAARLYCAAHAYTALVEDGPAAGLPDVTLTKAHRVHAAGLRALELADRAGVQIAYGSDLLGDLQRRQSEEFAIRAAVQSPASVLRGATTVAARLLRLEGQVGTLAPGGRADLILTRHNPLDDITRLADPHREVAAVVKAAALVSDRR
jgi:imidazolonepropionase-like amidohydrolase